MKTLIELYDERAIENVLAPEIFRPERVIYLCPEEEALDKRRQSGYVEFFRRRHLPVKVSFVSCSRFDADDILRKMTDIHEQYPDCAVDVTGGTDAALFASGIFADRFDVPAFTWSRRQNRFFNIRSAAFAEETPFFLTPKV